jgi:hypothetical protein
MSRLPLPERGQPLDVSYIYTLAESINNLYDQISPNTNRFITIRTPSDGENTSLSSGAKIDGAYIEVFTGGEVKVNDELPFELNLSGYKFVPIVTATPYNVGDSDLGNNVSIILTSVTKTKVVGFVKALSGGSIAVGVNVIVVGIPD